MADSTITTTTTTSAKALHSEHGELARLEDATESHPRGGTKGNAAAWAYQVAFVNHWLTGQLVCDECDDKRMWNGKPCRSCDANGRRLPHPRHPFPGADELLHGVMLLADFIGDVEARGGVENLPERSRAFVEELRSGLGARLMEIVGKVQDLEEDLCAVPDEVWPGGSYTAWRAGLHADAE